MKQGIPKTAQDLLARQAASEHPSADLLNGYVEQALTASEKTLVMNHLAACAECREVVFLANGVAQEEPGLTGISAARHTQHAGVDTASAGQRSPRWLWWKWAAPAFAVFVVAAAVLVERDRKPAKSHAVVEVATVEQPSRAPASTAEEKAEDLAVLPPTVNKKAGPRSKEAPESFLENETSAKDKRDVLARRQEPSQQTRYLAMQQSQMSRPQQSAGAAALGGALGAPGASQATAAATRPQAQPVPANVPPASNTVEVTSAAPLVQADNADLSTKFAANAPNGGNDLTYNQKPAAALKSGIATTQSAALDKSAAHKLAASAQWRISADGHLERASAGSAWTRVLADEPVFLRAVGVIGNDVWAGGNDGALFHSSNNGLNWTRVALNTNGQPERGAIVSIRFDSTLQGKVTTDGGEAWTTSDGGQSWQRQ